MPKIYNRYNFHKHTFCEFKEVNPDVLQNLEMSYKSNSGSCYYFTETGVYRSSNHWGRAANCRWRLLPTQKSMPGKTRIGYANWSDFYPNNEDEKMFFITMNWLTMEVNFQHKQNPSYKNTDVLRNANDTSKRIRLINEIIQDNTWAKYLDCSNLNDLREKVITQLICTNLSFLEVKRQISL